MYSKSSAADSDVLIAGAGPNGLFTALLLCHMNISVRIIDKRKRDALPAPLKGGSQPRHRYEQGPCNQSSDHYANTLVLLSPRTLQLLALVGLFDIIKARGRRHSQVQLFSSTTVTSTSMDMSAMASLIDTFALWDNKTTDYNFALSIDKKQLCDILESALHQRHGIQVDYGHTLVKKTNHHVGSDMVICDLQSRTSRNHLTTHTWRCLYLIASDAKSNLVQQQMAASMSSLNRKKKSKTKVYSIMARVETNYPEAQALSIISKPEASLFMLVHESYFSFVLQPSVVNDVAPLDLAACQQLIQRILQPHTIEFLETYDFSYFHGVPPTADQQQMLLDSRYFLLGNASQPTFPPGWFSTDLGFEQAMNLSWKLNLHLQRRSTPHLLNTYQSETRLRRKDASAASQLVPGVHRLMKACHHEDASVLLQEHRSCFTGGMLLEDNILNWNCPRSLQVHRGAVGTLAPNARMKPYNLQQLAVKARNNQLRQHQLTQKKKHSVSVNSLSSNEDDPATSPTTKRSFFRQLLPFSKKKPLADTAPSPSPVSFNLSIPPPPSTPSLAPTNTGNASNNTNSDKWRRIKANHYFLWDEIASHRQIQQSSVNNNNSSNNGNVNGNANGNGSKANASNKSFATFTLLILCGSLTDPGNVMALKRFGRHLDQANSFLRQFEYANHVPSHQPRRSTSTPTQNQQPSHHHYYASTPLPPLPTGYASVTPTDVTPPLSAASTTFSFGKTQSHAQYDFLLSPPTSPMTPLDNSRISTFTHLSSSTASSSTTTNGYAPSFRRSSSASSSSSAPLATLPLHYASSAGDHGDTAPLFSFTYLTVSPKPVCSAFIAEQTPQALDQLFPAGLDRVFLDHDHQAHSLYTEDDQQAPLAVVIRPDGYIGAKFSLNDDKQLYQMNRYFDGFLLPIVDMHSAAAMVANDFIF
ncbi:hypothetical protein BC940DRAFT_309604 [Gongronella butleri]|nr:hypothetical protein BC940DRAFT_309604 [Gongronella butleri]